MRELTDGAVFEVSYPFILDDFEYADEDGFGKMKSWRPGVRFEQSSRFLDSSDAVADGMGKMVLTVISTHKPGRFPTRVFYTRKWIRPDGKGFGKGGCRVVSIHGFRSLIKGYRHEIDRVTDIALTRTKEG